MTGQESLDRATEQQNTLTEMLEFAVVHLPSMQNKGFAVIGKTAFDKMDFIRKFFGAHKNAGIYVIIDCFDIKNYSDLIKILVKHQDVPYIIFNNCDVLLNHNKAVQAFKQLFEDFPSFTIMTKNDGEVKFETASYFIFLGAEKTTFNIIKERLSKGHSPIEVLWMEE